MDDTLGMWNSVLITLPQISLLSLCSHNPDLIGVMEVLKTGLSFHFILTVFWETDQLKNKIQIKAIPSPTFPLTHSPLLECNLWQKHILQLSAAWSQVLRVRAECWFWPVLRQERSGWWGGVRQRDRRTHRQIESRPRGHFVPSVSLWFVFMWLSARRLKYETTKAG